MNKKHLALLLVILIIPFCGCFGSPVTQSGNDEIPKNAIKIVPYSKTTHQYYSGYISNDHDGWGSSDNDEATEDYFWLDIRNIGRNDLNGLKCYITDLPSGWKLHEIDAIPEPGYNKLWVDFDKNNMNIITLHAQYDEETKEYHSELETTIMLRFRISTGIKGGFDYDNDQFPDSLSPNDPYYENEGVQVGYFPRDWYIHFHVDSETVKGDSVKLDIKIIEDKEYDGLSNLNKPYEYLYYNRE